MFRRTRSLTRDLFHSSSDITEQRRPASLALSVGTELIWAASVLVPVLFVISTLIGFSRNWMAILPGFWGVTTFILLLGVAVFIAYQPSTYVDRWRVGLLEKFARRA